MNKLFFIVLLFAYKICGAQITDDINCRVLQKLLSEKDFLKAINLVTPPNDKIFIIDTLNLFSGCRIEKSYNINIDIIPSYNLTIKEPNDYNRIKPYITIPKIQRLKRRVKIFYFHKETNRAGYIEYKVLKKRLKKVAYQFGQY